jgi:hypothetical protein
VIRTHMATVLMCYLREPCGIPQEVGRSMVERRFAVTFEKGRRRRSPATPNAAFALPGIETTIGATSLDVS